MDLQGMEGCARKSGGREEGASRQEEVWRTRGRDMPMLGVAPVASTWTLWTLVGLNLERVYRTTDKIGKIKEERCRQ